MCTSKILHDNHPDPFNFLRCFRTAVLWSCLKNLTITDLGFCWSSSTTVSLHFSFSHRPCIRILCRRKYCSFWLHFLLLFCCLIQGALFCFVIHGWLNYEVYYRCGRFVFRISTLRGSHSCGYFESLVFQYILIQKSSSKSPDREKSILYSERAKPLRRYCRILLRT